MNCQQAKKIDLSQFLKENGYNPVWETNSKAFFKSPLREDKNASFLVDKVKNLYYDYGTGQGGSIIDLGTNLFNCTVSQFLQKIDSSCFNSIEKIVNPYNSDLQILEIKEVRNSHLLKYAIGRKISPKFLTAFCKEVIFEINTKKLYAIGFPNCKGGFELRNEFYKGCSSPKAITHIKNGSKIVCVFEGFFDFLSYFEVNFMPSLTESDFIILNSTSLIEESTEILNTYNSIYLFLDNDSSGNKATIYLTTILKCKVMDCAQLYKGYNDVNSFLIQRS
jgi:hypothetical protein